MYLSGNPIIESCSNRKQKITFTDCHICRICSMHAQISDKQWVIRRNGPSSHDRCHYRNLCDVYNFRKYLGCIGNLDAAPC